MKTETIPEVTVVIPTYNHAHFLRAAIDSVRQQTFTNWELVVVNNFSEDDTVAVVEGFVDSRIRLENFKNHGIIAAARNRGIELAQARYVAFLDSDDLWYPAKLAHCLSKLSEGFDLVCHSVRWVGKGLDRKINYGPESRATYEALLFEENSIGTSATIVRRDFLEAVGRFREDPAIVTAEDYDLWLRLVRKGLRLGFLAEVLAEYRVHEGNQSKSVWRTVEAELKVVESHLESRGIQSGVDRLRLSRRKSLIYFHGARLFHYSQRYHEAWGCFFRAFENWPILLKLYPAMLLNLFHQLRCSSQGR